MEGPPGQIGGEGGLAGAGDAKVDVEHMGVWRTEKGPQEQRQIEQSRKNQDKHTPAPLKDSADAGTDQHQCR